MNARELKKTLWFKGTITIREGMREMATQLVTVADYRTALAEAVAARPERAWALACLALETAVRLIPHLQPHAALLSPLSAPLWALIAGVGVLPPAVQQFCRTAALERRNGGLSAES